MPALPLIGRVNAVIDRPENVFRKIIYFLNRGGAVVSAAPTTAGSKPGFFHVSPDAVRRRAPEFPAKGEQTPRPNPFGTRENPGPVPSRMF